MRRFRRKSGRTGQRITLGAASGVSAVIVILIIAVLVMAAVVAVPYIRGAGERAALALDKEQEDAAIQAARLYFADKISGFIGIYNPDGKSILEVDTPEDSKRRHASVAGYGVANAHEGMVIVVSVDDGGADIRTWWTKAEGVSDIIAAERTRKGLD